MHTSARSSSKHQALPGVQCLDDCRAHEWGLPTYKLERSRLHIKIGHMHMASKVLESVIAHLRENGADGLDSMLWEAKVDACTHTPVWLLRAHRMPAACCAACCWPFKL